MNRFTLHFAAFLGSASALALVLVAGISFACQSARAAMGGDKGSEMRFTPASRPQDGLSHPVNTGRHTGGKSVDLRRATREVAAGSPDFTNTHIEKKGLGPLGPANVSAGVTDRRDGRFAHSSLVTIRGGRSSSEPRNLRSKVGSEGRVASEQGVRSVPGRAVPNDVVLLRDARGHLLSLATSAANLCGVPVRLFHSLIARESSWNPRARSSSGALGLGQLMPAAAKEMGVQDRLDPWQNVLGAACFLRKQYDRAGSWRKALLSYHAGPNRLRTSQATHDYARDIIVTAIGCGIAGYTPEEISPLFADSPSNCILPKGWNK